MFVSSFSTYVAANSTQKVSKDYNVTKKPSVNFDVKNTDVKTTASVQNSNIPINYVTTPQAFSNKMKLMQKDENGEKESKNSLKKFTAKNTTQAAKQSYADNAIMFPLLRKPQVSIGSATNVMGKKENILQDLNTVSAKKHAVNTYQENDKYHRITA